MLAEIDETAKILIILGPLFLVLIFLVIVIASDPDDWDKEFGNSRRERR